MSEENEAVEKDFDVTEPIIINLGKQKPKRIKNLLKGRGKLWFEVQDVIDEVGELLSDELEGKTVVPLVLVYGKKPKKKKSLGLFGY